jgi:hypothetical protein
VAQTPRLGALMTTSSTDHYLRVALLGGLSARASSVLPATPHVWLSRRPGLELSRRYFQRLSSAKKQTDQMHGGAIAVRALCNSLAGSAR